MKRVRLSSEVKVFIIQMLAAYCTPTEVVSAVKEEFGLVLTRSHVHFYDPTTKFGAGLSEKLKTLFAESRTAVNRSVALGAALRGQDAPVPIVTRRKHEIAILRAVYKLGLINTGDFSK